MALGHWLKDYLGPKAYGEGGGGAVEVSKIKLGTAYGSVSDIGSTTGSVFKGGLSLADTETPTIGDIIGDKQVVGFAFEGRGANSKVFPLAGQFWDSTEGNILHLNNEDIKARTGGNVTGVAEPLETVTQPITIDVYAICI